MDQYNYGTNPDRPGSSWRWFDAIFRQTYDELSSLAPSKPIMIGETASSEYGGSKAEWIKDALLVQLPSKYPRVKAWVWFNWNHRTTKGYMDYVIESSQAAQTAYQESMASSYYATNSFGGLPKLTKLLPLTP
jgi:mannan endo-1,4-beta-mannosidase